MLRIFIFLLPGILSITSSSPSIFGKEITGGEILDEFFRYNPSTVERNLLQEDANYCINESTIVYTDYDNQPSVVGTLIKCMQSIQDSLLCPIYNSQIPLVVNVTTVFNNLIAVQELTLEVQFDFLSVMSWIDKRLDMPALWAACDPSVLEYGVDITQVMSVFSIQNVQVVPWVPDLIFPDATDSIVQVK